MAYFPTDDRLPKSELEVTDELVDACRDLINANSYEDPQLTGAIRRTWEAAFTLVEILRDCNAELKVELLVTLGRQDVIDRFPRLRAAALRLEAERAARDE